MNCVRPGRYWKPHFHPVKEGLRRFLEVVGQRRAGSWEEYTVAITELGPDAKDRSGYSLKPQVLALKPGSSDKCQSFSGWSQWIEVWFVSAEEQNHRKEELANWDPESWGRVLESASQNQGKKAWSQMKQDIEVRVLSWDEICPRKVCWSCSPPYLWMWLYLK